MEDLNQDQVLTNEEGFFDDLSDDEIPAIVDEENKEPTAEEPTETVETPVEEPAKPFLKVKYNGEEREMSEDEARTYTQKGMNYDHLYDKYMGEHGELERIAKLNGMNAESFLKSLGDTQIQYEINKEVQNLKNENPDAPESLLEELAVKRVHERIGNFKKDEEASQKEQADAQLEAVRKDIAFLQELYPDLDLNNLPQEVFDNVDKGMDLAKAYLVYQKHLSDQSKPQEEAKEQIDKLNEENKKKSLGNITNAGNDQPDDFFNGFNSI